MRKGGLDALLLQSFEGGVAQCIPRAGVHEATVSQA